jgi:predicted Zn-ribbon and HTH transcriptional regulator
MFPLWLVCLTFAVLPTQAVVAAVRRRRKMHRVREGICASCGYDMRATPDRCPECGKPPHNPSMQRTVPAV